MNGYSPVLLFSNQTAAGGGTIITIPVGVTSAIIEFAGNFDGSTATMQTSLDGQNWNDVLNIDLTTFTITENFAFGMAVGEGMQIRANLSDVSPNTSVTAGLYYRRGA